MTPETLVMIAGAGIALVVGYVPSVKAWYEKQSGDTKRQVMGAALVGAAGVVAAASCVPVIGSVVPADWLVQCNQASLGELVRLTFFALGANQGTYLLAVRQSAKG